MERWLVIGVLLLVVANACALDELHEHEALLSLDDNFDNGFDTMLEDYHYDTPEDQQEDEFENSVAADNLAAAHDELAGLELSPTLLETDEEVHAAPKSKVPSGKPTKTGGRKRTDSDMPAMDLPIPSFRTGKCKNKLPDVSVRADMLNTRYKRVCVKWSTDSKKANTCKLDLVVRLPRISKRYARLLKTGKVRQKVCGIATMRGSDCKFRNRKASCVTIGRLVKAYNVRLREAVDRVVHCYLQTKDRKRCSDPVVSEEDENKVKAGKKGSVGAKTSKHSKGKGVKVAKKKQDWWMWPDDTKKIKAKGVWMPGPLLDTEKYDEVASKIKSKGDRAAKIGGVKVQKKGKEKRVGCKSAEIEFRKAEKKLMNRKKLCSEGSAAERGACEEKLRKQVHRRRQAQRRCHKKFYH